jgi:hypothetical protein
MSAVGSNGTVGTILGGGIRWSTRFKLLAGDLLFGMLDRFRRHIGVSHGRRILWPKKALIGLGSDKRYSSGHTTLMFNLNIHSISVRLKYNKKKRTMFIKKIIDDIIFMSIQRLTGTTLCETLQV